jgi:electron transport complex protein RnfD
MAEEAAKTAEKEKPAEPSVKYVVSPAPHLFAPESVPAIMWTVIATLLPAGAAGVYFFGFPALGVILATIAGAVMAELLGERFLLGKKRMTVGDGSAVLTGLLLAFCLPPGIDPWRAWVGGAISIFVAKTVFGGLGQNVFNPALIGRAALLAAWPAVMTKWTLPKNGIYVPQGLSETVFRGVDAVSGPTPLAAVKMAAQTAARDGASLPLDQLAPSWLDLQGLFLGNVGGCIGETCALALLIGGLWLLWRKLITWPIPVVYVATVFVLTVAFAAPAAFGADAGAAPAALLRIGLFHVLAGGLFLGAFFMATDMVTSPLTAKGQAIFAFGAGVLVVMIRRFGGYPEGVCYSILLMNMITPLIDRYTLPRKFGKK